jgi:hypothetical protein
MSNNVISDDPIKKPNTKTAFSEANLVELIQCMDDPMYFMKTFMRIQHPTKGAIPFDPYPFQEKLIRGFNEHRFSIALTARQMGKTTCAAGFLLWKAMFTPDTTILIVANNFNGALEIMSRVKYAYENLPDYIRAGVTKFNEGSVNFDNGSRIVARATSPDAARGLSITLLYIDEFAFLRSSELADKFWTSVQPTLSTGGSCIITSTPKSDEDQFAQIWKGATDLTDEYGNPTGSVVGRNGFHGIMVPWWEHPERGEAWAKPFRETLGPARFGQEFECQFFSDDLTLISSTKLGGMKFQEPEFYTGTVRWFKMPEANKTYLVGLDPSIGAGGDNAALQVFEMPGMIQVAEWQHNGTVAKGQVRILMQTLDFIEQSLRDNPNQRGDPELYWTVENNTIGEHVLQIIEDTGEERFPGIFISEKKKKGASRRFRKGLNTDNKKKVSACARFKSLIETDRMILRSRGLIRELKFFVGIGGVTFKAKAGEHDDLVMATLLCVRMLDLVAVWGINDLGNFSEHISEEELYSQEPMPVLV